MDHVDQEAKLDSEVELELQDSQARGEDQVLMDHPALSMMDHLVEQGQLVQQDHLVVSLVQMVLQEPQAPQVCQACQGLEECLDHWVCLVPEEMLGLQAQMVHLDQMGYQGALGAHRDPQDHRVFLDLQVVEQVRGDEMVVLDLQDNLE